MSNKKRIIEPINASFDEVSKAMVSPKKKKAKKIPGVFLPGHPYVLGDRYVLTTEMPEIDFSLLR